MKKRVLFFLFYIAIVTRAVSQTNHFPLTDSFRKYFNYDTLGNFSCKQVPVGVYSLSFKVNTAYSAYDIHFSEDSLPQLKQLLTAALQKSLTTIHLNSADKPYLLLILYNNIMGCNPPPDSTEFKPETINRQLIGLLNDQIISFQRTFKSLIHLNQEFIVLKTVVIDNDNPNRPWPRHLVNDNTGGKSSAQKEKIE